MTSTAVEVRSLPIRQRIKPSNRFPSCMHFFSLAVRGVLSVGAYGELRLFQGLFSFGFQMRLIHRFFLTAFSRVCIWSRAC